MELPLVNTATVQNSGQIVQLFCLENRCYLRVNKHGRLFADVKEEENAPTLPEADFMLYTVADHPGKFAFRSLPYRKFLTRGTTFPRFRFPVTNLAESSDTVSPHSLFEIQGEYLLVFGQINTSRFLHVGYEDQVFPDGNNRKKSRITMLVKKTCGVEEMEIASAWVPPALSRAGSSVASLTSADSSLNLMEEDTPLAVLSTMSPRRRAASISQNTQGPATEGTAHRDPLLPPMIQKFNSTSSLYIKDTIVMPDIDELAWCISVAVSRLVMQGNANPKKVYLDIFDERNHPLQMKNQPPPEDLYRVPTEDDVYLFIQPILHKLRVKPESGVLSLVYIEKLISNTGLTLDTFLWRKVVLSCIILATKVYEELAVWNADFKEVFPSLSVHDLNRIEMELLKALDFHVSLPASTYVKYFFAIRDLSELDPARFPIKPLDKNRLERLEVSSKASESRARKAFLSHSTSQLAPIDKSPFVVLS